MDVPLYQTDNSPHGTAFTKSLGIWQGINYRLDILVENLGRNNSRPQFAEEKGILGEVKFSTSRVYGFTCMPHVHEDFRYVGIQNPLNEKNTFCQSYSWCFLFVDQWTVPRYSMFWPTRWAW